MDALRRRRPPHGRHTERLRRLHRLPQRRRRHGLSGVQSLEGWPYLFHLATALWPAGACRLHQRSPWREQRLAYLAARQRQPDRDVLGKEPQQQHLRHRGEHRGALFRGQHRCSRLYQDRQHHHRARFLAANLFRPARECPALCYPLRVGRPVYIIY